MLEMYLIACQCAVQLKGRMLDVLIEERFEEKDFISLLNECHERTQHSLVCTSSDCDFGIRIDWPAHEWAVGFGNGLLQSWTAL